jgi:CRP-like cAMP-binding protein
MTNPIWQNIFRSRGYEQTLAYFLSSQPFFSKLDKRELRFLEKLVHVRKYQGDETIFREKDIGSGMYFIRSGQVQIFESDEQGQESELVLLESGDFFGEVALTASRPRNASARTTEPTVLVGLFRSDLEEASRHSPAPTVKILLGLNRVICDRLLSCNQQLADLRHKLAATNKRIDNADD